MVQDRKPSLRDALASADFRGMLAAYTVSRAGDFLYNVALVVIVLERTGSPSYVALLATLKILPYVVLTPFAGLLADRVDRVRLMVTSDLARAGCMVVLALLVAGSAPVLAVVLVATLAGVAGTPHLSCFTATLPGVLPERHLAGGNSLVGAVEYVAMVAGPAGAAVLLVLGPDPVPFLLNAGSFLVSALLLGGVKRRGRVEQPRGETTPEPQEGRAGSARVLMELRQGVESLRGDRNLLALSLCLVAVAGTYGFELVYLVLVSDRQLGIGTSGVGILEAAVGAGGVLGVGLAARLATSGRPRAVLVGIVVFSTIPLALLALVDDLALALPLLLVEGAASVALDVVLITTMQRVVAPERMARVDGIIGSLATGGVLLGSLLAVPLLATIGLRPALVVAGVVPAALALAGLAVSRRLDAGARGTGERLAPVVAALSDSGAFTGVPRDRLERLAGEVVRQLVPAGGAVLRQGDAADALYVLETGRCSVRVDGAEVSQMEAPDFFGEIGVLQGRPRTATVVALTDCDLLRVSGADFLAAIQAGPIPTPLSAKVEQRLARPGRPSRAGDVDPDG